MIDRAETFIGWRYLFRRRRSRLVVTLTAVQLLYALVSITLFLTLRFPPGSAVPVLLALTAVLDLLLLSTFFFLNFFSTFTTVSMTGVFWGVAALTVVLSVTSGFQEEFQSKVLGVNAHMLTLKYGLDFAEYREKAKEIEQVPHVVPPVVPFVFNEMIVAHGPTLSSGVLVKGIQPDRSTKVLDIGQWMVEGNVASLDHPPAAKSGEAQLPSMLLGKELARKLRVHVGDSVRLIAPLGDDAAGWTPDKAPKTRDFRVTGIFYSGFDEYDRRLACIDLPEAQALVGAGDVVTGLEWRLDDIYRSKEVQAAIEAKIGGSPYRVIDWRELNHNLFTALKLQKLALGIILFLIILVAMFGVVATMTMLVIDKTREIAIIKSIGMRSSSIAWTFQVAGMTISALGTAAGLGLGLAICGLLSRFSYHLDPRVYLIDRLPVKVHPLELVLVAAVTLAVSFLATLLPSLRAASLRPVEGLRYE